MTQIEGVSVRPAFSLRPTFWFFMLQHFTKQPKSFCDFGAEESLDTIDGEFQEHNIEENRVQHECKESL